MPLLETNPWAWYADADVLRLELELIFRRSWHYVGHEGLLEEPGACVPAAVGDVPVVVVRGDDGELRAFVNVCRHRGAVVVEEPARRRTLQCPYHAWTYGLDGRLLAAPRSEREAPESLDGLSLHPARVGRWGPLVFVAVDSEAPPLEAWLGDLPRLLGVELSTLRFRERAHSELAANWKIAVENYLECYHCPVAHRGFSDLVDVAPEAYRLERHDGRWSQYGSARDDESRAEFHLVWPSFRVNVFPGPPNLSVGPLLPAGAERTTGFLDYFFGEDVDEAAARELLDLDDVVGREDAALVESVQRGVRGGVVERGTLLPQSEQLVAGFQRKVRGALGQV